MKLEDTIRIMLAKENRRTATITVEKFEGGTCEIESFPDEPDRFWIKVRFDAQDGGGYQFECWRDELPMLEQDIQTNFAHCNVATIPLEPPIDEAETHA